MKKDYSKLEKDDLLKVIEKLESRKKYGLVWDEEKTKEQFEKESENALPVLKEVKDREIKTDPSKPTNVLIEGDNYHALSVLNYTHQGKIDVIYIDPPYNRGGDFKYNDKYVEKDDAYRHSKWLSFLSKRLRLAKNLLRDEGVMFVSIDDSEQAQLRLLLNEVFGEDNVDIMVWRKSGYGRDGKMKNTTTFRKDHEYILVCYKYEKTLNKINELPDFQGDYTNPDNDLRGPWLSGSISRADYASDPEHQLYYAVLSPSGKKISRQFEITKDDFDDLNSDNRISWGAKGDAVPRLKIFLSEERAVTPYSILLTKGTTTEGTKEVSEILSKDCAEMRPKPTRLIKTLIQLADKNKDLTVLDFFAGTGTTGHAALKYGIDAKDKTVKFILCTNDDEKICTDYCYPRLRKVMKTGYKNKDDKKLKPILGNLKYFKTAFVPKDEVSDDTRRRLVQQSTEMICLKEGTFEAEVDNTSYKIFTDRKKITGILFNLKKIDEFKKKINTIKLQAHLYIFSLTNDAYEEDFGNLLVKHKIVPIPESILEVYRKLFKKA